MRSDNRRQVARLWARLHELIHVRECWRAVAWVDDDLGDLDTAGPEEPCPPPRGFLDLFLLLVGEIEPLPSLVFILGTLNVRHGEGLALFQNIQ